MNKTPSEARILTEDVLREIGKFDDAEIVLCPPFTALAAVSELLSPGAQRAARRAEHA